MFNQLYAQQNGVYECEITAGNLYRILPKDHSNIRKLKLKGSLNADDIKIIKDLPNLSVLDLTSSSLEIGGLGYESKYFPGRLITVSNKNELPDAAFADLHTIKKIDLPNPLVSIGSYAFRGAQSLEILNIPNSLRKIGTHCFEKCISLRKLVLNKNIDIIPISAFQGCSNLQSVEKVVAIEIQDAAFKDCTNLTTTGRYNGLKKIGDEAYFGCKSIPYVFIPSSIEIIGNNAFANCENLHILYIRALRQMGDNIFNNCSNLVSVSVPIGVEKIAKGMFANCIRLKEFWASKDLKTICEDAFANCKELVTFRIENTIPPALEKNVFCGIESKNVTIQVPNGKVDLYESDPIWGKFKISELEVNDRGTEIVTINLKKGSKKILKFGLRITQPFTVDMGNGNVYKRAPGTLISSKSQVVCDEHGDVIRIYSMPNALISFVENELEENDIESITFNAPELDYVWMSNSLISKLDVTLMPKLNVLIVSNNPNLEDLNLSNNPNLTYLNISLNEKLKNIDLKNNPKLKVLSGSMLNLSNWDFNNNKEIVTLDVFMTPITNLDISMLKKLKSLKISGCKINTLSFPKGADSLSEVFMTKNNLNAITLNNIFELLPQRDLNDKAKIYIKGNPGAEASSTIIAEKKNWSVDVKGTGGEEPDPFDPNKETPAVDLFISKASSKFSLITSLDETVYIDWGDKSEIEKKQVKSGDLHSLTHKYSDGTPQHEIRIFAKGITTLTSPFWSTMGLTNLDVSNCPTLEKISMPNGNDLISVDFSKNNALKEIDLAGSKLSSIKLPSERNNMVSIKLSTNDIKEIDVKDMSNLEILSIPSNSLKTLDLTGCNNLKTLNLNLNGLESVKGILSLPALDELDIAKNNLPFSNIPPKKDMKKYIYNQYWYDVPSDLISGLKIDLRKENKAQGISDKKEQTTFKWFIFKSKNERIEITEDKYTNEEGLFTFKSEVFPEGMKEMSVYAIMTNPGFPEINVKTSGLTTGLIKLTKPEESVEVDPSKFETMFEGLYECAFRNAQKLVDIRLPKNTKSIRDYAFNSCKSLKVAIVSVAVDTLSSKAFDDIEGLIIYVPTKTVKQQFDEVLKFKNAQVVVGTEPASSNAITSGLDYTVSIYGDKLIVRSLSDKVQQVSVFGEDGTLFHNSLLEPTNVIQATLPSGGIYILKVNQTISKVFIP